MKRNIKICQVKQILLIGQSVDQTVVYFLVNLISIYLQKNFTKHHLRIPTKNPNSTASHLKSPMSKNPNSCFTMFQSMQTPTASITYKNERLYFEMYSKEQLFATLAQQYHKLQQQQLPMQINGMKIDPETKINDIIKSKADVQVFEHLLSQNQNDQIVVGKGQMRDFANIVHRLVKVEDQKAKAEFKKIYGAKEKANVDQSLQKEKKDKEKEKKVQEAEKVIIFKNPVSEKASPEEEVSKIQTSTQTDIFYPELQSKQQKQQIKPQLKEFTLNNSSHLSQSQSSPKIQPKITKQQVLPNITKKKPSTPQIPTKGSLKQTSTSFSRTTVNSTKLKPTQTIGKSQKRIVHESYIKSINANGFYKKSTKVQQTKTLASHQKTSQKQQNQSLKQQKPIIHSITPKTQPKKQQPPKTPTTPHPHIYWLVPLKSSHQSLITQHFTPYNIKPIRFNSIQALKQSFYTLASKHQKQELLLLISVSQTHRIDKAVQLMKMIYDMNKLTCKTIVVASNNKQETEKIIVKKNIKNAKVTVVRKEEELVGKVYQLLGINSQKEKEQEIKPETINPEVKQKQQIDQNFEKEQQEVQLLLQINEEKNKHLLSSQLNIKFD